MTRTEANLSDSDRRIVTEYTNAAAVLRDKARAFEAMNQRLRDKARQHEPLADIPQWVRRDNIDDVIAVGKEVRIQFKHGGDHVMRETRDWLKSIVEASHD